MTKSKPTALFILDGWGHSEQRDHNAIFAANTPTWDKLWQTAPRSLLSASSRAVGLPDGQMGNSEVGHMHIGAGRWLPQPLVQINEAIANGAFNKLPALNHTKQTLNQHPNARIHLISLLSPGGVHSHENHLYALLKHLAEHNRQTDCLLHLILDGRDVPPQSAKASLNHCEALLKQLNYGQIASLCGRYYGMDRDQRWDRTAAAFQAMCHPQHHPANLDTPNHSANSASAALSTAYARGETDEFVVPTQISSQQAQGIQDGDVVIFMNFRADRARQLSNALSDPNFSGFSCTKPLTLRQFVTLSDYQLDTQPTVLFPNSPLQDTLGQVIANAGLTQCRIAETEKYAHVTFFFNGGQEKPYPGETRVLIPSPDVSTYDLQPEMSAHALTDTLVKRILAQEDDFIVCNFANPDMVGHTGNFAATVRAIETVDHCLNRLNQALLQVNGCALITADHGNADCLYDPEIQQPHTAHTTAPVPLVYVGHEHIQLAEKGCLYDVAPTLLELMQLPIPTAMTGHTLAVG